MRRLRLVEMHAVPSICRDCIRQRQHLVPDHDRLCAVQQHQELEELRAQLAKLQHVSEQPAGRHDTGDGRGEARQGCRVGLRGVCWASARTGSPLLP